MACVFVSLPSKSNSNNGDVALNDSRDLGQHLPAIQKEHTTNEKKHTTVKN